MDKQIKKNYQKNLFTLQSSVKPPDFEQLLNNPTIDAELPKDWNVHDEAEHIAELWKKIDRLKLYKYESFMHAGGSGIVFKVFKSNEKTPLALKIGRKKLFSVQKIQTDAAENLSPLSETELKVLEKLSHPNVVRLYEAIENEHGVISIVTSFVDNALSIDDFFKKILRKPRPETSIFSSKRLDAACTFLIERVLEINSAISHMHENGIIHFDIKPTNILISSQRKAILTDMGSCIDLNNLPKSGKLRAHFTWTYANPNLQSIINDPDSLAGGGLKASSSIKKLDSIERYDLYAFGKTIQELLAILEGEFRERCYGSYPFRYLHIIVCLLLDGQNAPGKRDSRFSRIIEKDGKRFADDVAFGYSPMFYEINRIISAEELADKLRRFRREHSWNTLVPELDNWQPHIINSVAHPLTSFTKRVSAIFDHPALRRLRLEPQLGWIREVYPGATHDRWTHSLGVFSAVVQIYNSLLSDPEVPTFRILADQSHICHGFLAAILHDLGQTTFGHDFEEACPSVFSHEKFLRRLLDETEWSKTSLWETILSNWYIEKDTPFINKERLLKIIEFHQSRKSGSRETIKLHYSIDGIAADAIDGPIDADKLDYLIRDSIFCGVPYGNGIDTDRFFKALTVTNVEDLDTSRLALAYKAKGRAAITSLLLARYQMYGAVYWHHTFRCIQSMLVYAISITFSEIGPSRKKCRDFIVTDSLIADLYYHRVVCRKSWNKCINEIKSKSIKNSFIEPIKESPPTQVSQEIALEFIWFFSSDEIRKLIENIAERNLYKRVFEIRVGDLGPRADYSELKLELDTKSRFKKAVKLQDYLIKQIDLVMRKRGTSVTVTENVAKNYLDDFKSRKTPLIIIDFPMRGIPGELNKPREIEDPIRKYTGISNIHVKDADVIFHDIRDLQMRLACLRVFAYPDFHDLIMRYLTPGEIRSCVESVIPQIRRG